MNKTYLLKAISIIITVVMLMSTVTTSAFAAVTSEKNSGNPEFCSHKLVFDAGTSPTCQESGIAEHYVCTECGRTFKDTYGVTEIEDVTLPPEDHDWDSMYTRFGEKGHAYYCYNCSEHTLIEDHIYGEFSFCVECGFKKPKPLNSLEKKVWKAHSDISKDSAREIVKYAEKKNIPSDVILVTAKNITTQKSEEVKEADYLKLSARSSGVSDNKITIKWNKVKGVDGYIVFGSKCSGKFKELKFVDKNKTSFTQKNLKKGTYYKYVVVAYSFVEDVNLYVSISKTVHTATSGGEYGNPKTVKVNKSKVVLKKGQTFIVKATAVKQNKKSKTHRNIRFESNKTKIATVSNKGKIKAKKKGACYVYAYAQNGVAKKLKVIVK